MKILYIITGLRFGGAEKLLYLTCKYLRAEHSAAIRVIYFDPYAPMRSLFTEINVDTEWIRCNLALLPRLILRMRRGHYDIIHTHLIHADIFGRIAAMLSALKMNHVIFSTVHDLDWFRWQKSLYFSIVRKIDCWLTKPERCHVIAISNSVKNMLIEKQNYNTDKITILYNAIEINSQPQSKSSHKSVKCLYLGRLVKKKNIPCMLRAIALLRSSNLVLNIVGEGEEESSLVQMVREFNLDHCVNFFPATLDVESYYKESDIFILPSSYEGLGIVILEAFSHCLPVIGSDVHGISELLADDRGLLFQNNNAQELAEKIDVLITDPQKRNYYGRRGYEYVKAHHDIHDYVHQLQLLYSNCKLEQTI